jgi:hypothetical protein
MNSSASGDALDDAEEPGGAEQPADRRLGPSGRDHRSDHREERLAKHPDSIVGREIGEPVHRGT